MTLQELGYTTALEQYRTEQQLSSFNVGRVILEHKGRYILKTPDAEIDAELIGNLRFSAESRYDYPAVGDWVAFSEYDTGKGLIHAIFPRSSILERQAVGKTGQVQIIATNIDVGLIVQAVDRDFNLNRLERYLTICYASKVDPIVVLSKIDLIESTQLEVLKEQILRRIKEVPILTTSNTSNGYDQIKALIQTGKTYCLLGSSGVGKSTLLNAISGEELMAVGAISSSVNKGKHTTSHRELIVLPGEGILIDNPGMREVGIADMADGLEITFDAILELAQQCRYKDCTHVHENGCAVLEALETGELDEDAYYNFRKMQKEKAHFETDVLERKKKDKELGRLIKHIKKERKSKKY